MDKTNTSIIKCGVKLLIHSQTSTVQPMNLRNGLVISFHTVLSKWALIHAGIKVNLCYQRGPRWLSWLFTYIPSVFGSYFYLPLLIFKLKLENATCLVLHLCQSWWLKLENWVQECQKTGLLNGPLCTYLMRQNLHNRTRPGSQGNKCPCQVSKWSVKNYGRESVNGACLPCRPPAGPTSRSGDEYPRGP